MSWSLENLRRKPKAVRNRYAFYVAVTVTIFVVSGWAVTVPTRFDSEAFTNQQRDNNNGSFSRALADIQNQMSTVVSSLQAALPVATSTESEKSATDERFTIDIDAMFATTTATATPIIPPAPIPQYILIATTSSETHATTAP